MGAKGRVGERGDAGRPGPKGEDGASYGNIIPGEPGPKGERGKCFDSHLYIIYFYIASSNNVHLNLRFIRHGWKARQDGIPR